jgi:hypothetical protein
MGKRMALLLLLLLPVGLGGCSWLDGGREGNRPGDYRQADYRQGYGQSAWNSRQGANTPGHAYDGQLR